MGLFDGAMEKLKAVETAGSSLLKSAYDAASDKLSSAANTVKDAGVSLVNTVSETVTGTKAINVKPDNTNHPSVTVSQGESTFRATGRELYRQAGAAINTVMQVTSALSTGKTDAVNLISTGVNTWVSPDKRISFEKVSSFNSSCSPDACVAEFNELWSLYDQQVEGKPSKDGSMVKGAFVKAEHVAGAPGNTLEMTNVFEEVRAQQSAQRTADSSAGTPGAAARDASAREAATSDASATNAANEQARPMSREYQSSGGEVARVTVSQGRAQYERRDSSGNVVTRAESTAEGQVLQHGNETATRRGDTVTVTGEGHRVVQRDGRTEVTAGGETAVSENGEVRVRGQRFRREVARLTSRVFGYGTTDEMRQAEQQAQERGWTIRFAEDTLETVIDMGEVKVHVRPDENGEAVAIIKGPEGAIMIRPNRELFYFKDGEWHKLSRGNCPRGATVDSNGEVRMGELTVRNGRAFFGTVALDVSHLAGIGLVDTSTNETARVQITDDQLTIENENKEITANGEGEVVTTEDGREISRWTPSTNRVETPEAIFTENETVIKSTGTVIEKDNTVHMGGRDKNGPILYGNGDMKLDDQTFISHDGSVSSGSFHASANFAGAQVRSAEVVAQSSIQSAAATAEAVKAKALSGAGKVTFSDIGALNNNLGEISGLINRVSAMPGNAALLAALNHSYAQVLAAINIALPKAQQNEAENQQRLSASAEITPLRRQAGTQHDEGAAMVLRAA